MRMIKQFAALIIARLMCVSAVLLTGCAGVGVPKDISEPQPGYIQFSEVKANPDAYKGQSVRWGGLIASLSEEEGNFWLEIVELPLDKEGRPLRAEPSAGRFILKSAKDSSFVIGREITATGMIAGTFSGTIGKRPYDFPIIDSVIYYTWNEQNVDDCDLWPYQFYPYYSPYPYHSRYPRTHLGVGLGIYHRL